MAGNRRRRARRRRRRRGPRRRDGGAPAPYARARSATPYVCRSNGREQLNYRLMLDDARAGLSTKPWTRRIWYPLSRLTQVEWAARLEHRLLLLNAQDYEYALDQKWQQADRVE